MLLVALHHVLSVLCTVVVHVLATVRHAVLEVIVVQTLDYQLFQVLLILQLADTKAGNMCQVAHISALVLDTVETIALMEQVAIC